jgi:hypothetical protein
MLPSIKLISSVLDCYPGPPGPDQASVAPMHYGRPSDPPQGPCSGWSTEPPVPHVAGGMLQLTCHGSVSYCELHLLSYCLYYSTITSHIV